MLFFVWTPALRVGLEEMDTQHQGLIQLMARLHDEGTAHVPKPVFVDTLGQFARLTVRHFADEEAAMASFDYPRLDIHQDQHRRLLERFDGYRVAIGRPDGRFTESFTGFLRDWLTGHIKGADTQYGVYSGALTRRD